MQFVLARPHEHSTADWYLLLDEDSIDYAIEYFGQMKSFMLRKYDDPTATSVNARLITEYPLIIQERLGWYMNRMCGTCDKLHTIEFTKHADKFPPTPMSDQKLFESVILTGYPNGSHCYAKLVDGRDVEVGGLSKFDSEDEARIATAEFLKLTRLRDQLIIEFARKVEPIVKLHAEWYNRVFGQLFEQIFAGKESLRGQFWQTNGPELRRISEAFNIR